MTPNKNLLPVKDKNTDNLKTSIEEDGLYFLIYLISFYIITLLGDFLLGLCSLYGNNGCSILSIEIKNREFMNLEQVLSFLFRYVRPFFGSLIMIWLNKYHKNNIISKWTKNKTLGIFSFLLLILIMFIYLIEFTKSQKPKIYNDSDTMATGSLKKL